MQLRRQHSKVPTLCEHSLNTNKPPRADGYLSAGGMLTIGQVAAWNRSSDTPSAVFALLLHPCLLGGTLFKRVSVPQDETLWASLLQHHVIGSFRWGEDVRRQRGAEATCGAQVQLTHLQAQNQVSCHATEPVSCIYQDKKASTTMPKLPWRISFQKHVSTVHWAHCFPLSWAAAQCASCRVSLAGKLHYLLSTRSISVIHAHLLISRQTLHFYRNFPCMMHAFEKWGQLL